MYSMCMCINRRACDVIVNGLYLSVGVCEGRSQCCILLLDWIDWVDPWNALCQEGQVVGSVNGSPMSLSALGKVAPMQLLMVSSHGRETWSHGMSWQHIAATLLWPPDNVRNSFLPAPLHSSPANIARFGSTMHRSEATMLWDVQHTAITRNVDYWGASTKSYLATKQVSSKICPVPPVQSWSERGKQSENSAELRVFKACHAGRSGDDKILRPNNDPIDFQQWPWPLWAPVNCDLRDCFPPHIEWSRRIPNTSR